MLYRPGFNLPPDLPPNFKRATPLKGTIFSSQEMSSSEVRNRVQKVNYGDRVKQAMEKGDAWMIDGLIPGAVRAHMIRYRLYQTAAAATTRAGVVDAESLEAPSGGALRNESCCAGGVSGCIAM